MSVKRSGALAMSALVLVLIVGAVQASAQSAPTVLKFYDSGGQTTGVGFDLNNPNAMPPVGSSNVNTVTLENIGSQSESRVVRRSAMCSCSAPYCSSTCHGRSSTGSLAGSAHVPDGFFTFGGNGGFGNGHVSYYDITGGVGPVRQRPRPDQGRQRGQRRARTRRSRFYPSRHHRPGASSPSVGAPGRANQVGSPGTAQRAGRHTFVEPGAIGDARRPRRATWSGITTVAPLLIVRVSLTIC